MCKIKFVVKQMALSLFHIGTLTLLLTAIQFTSSFLPFLHWAIGNKQRTCITSLNTCTCILY